MPEGKGINKENEILQAKMDEPVKHDKAEATASEM